MANIVASVLSPRKPSTPLKEDESTSSKIGISPERKIELQGKILHQMDVA